MNKLIINITLILLPNIATLGQPFITTWKSDNPGSTSPSQITLPSYSVSSNYTVYWEEVGNPIHNGNAGPFTDLNWPHVIDFGIAGTYRVEISGDFKGISFTQDNYKILSVEQWGEIAFTNMFRAFFACSELTIPATDAPNLSLITNLSEMFHSAISFNQPIAHWNVSNITNMSGMFYGASAFNKDLNGWDVSNVTDMSFMFSSAISFNGQIDNWNVNNVVTMRGMFSAATAFNQPIGTWSLGNLIDMIWMFHNASSFNHYIGGWDVSKINSMEQVFYGATAFNQSLSEWNVSNVTNMSGMFFLASSFNQDLNNWNVSNVTEISNMFSYATSYNQDMNDWDVSNVIGMTNVFSGASSFNGNIMNWNVGNVLWMYGMFQGATSFNQDITNWNVAKVIDMRQMFLGAYSFNQNLGNWNIEQVNIMSFMLNGTNISTENYDATLNGWATQNVKANVALGAVGLTYCNSSSAREILTSAPNYWLISGDYMNCPPPIISSFTPTSGTVGTVVIILGTNFSSIIDNNIVHFNGTQASVTASTNTNIITSVPVGATTGAITITVDGQAGTSATSFLVIHPPTITSFMPNSGPVGTIVTITGTTFSTTPANNIVRFNGTPATVIASTTTSITTSVPIDATTGAITVTISGQTAESVTNFTVETTSSVEIIADGRATPTGSNITFSNTGVGSQQLKKLEILNTGTANLVITDIQVTGDFSLVSTLPPPVAPGSSTIINLAFAPTDLGQRYGTLTILSNGDVPVFTLNLLGEGDAEPEVYNVVTANPNGKHDFLNIRNITLFPNNRVTIYDRWGNRVYEKESYDNVTNPFTGKSDKGKELPDGTYYYVIDKNNGSDRLTGFILLRR